MILGTKRIQFTKDGEAMLPKKLTEVVDLLYVSEQERYALQKGVDRLKRIETACREKLIDSIDLTETKGCVGTQARIEIEPVRVPQVEDWDAFYRHVRRTGEFELLHQRLSTKAVEDRWEHKKTVPGVAGITVKKVHLYKLKKK